VASAIRIIAKAELTGGLGRILPTSPHGEEILLGNITSEEGIGWRAILQKIAGSGTSLEF
jgi:hypothetical protein